MLKNTFMEGGEKSAPKMWEVGKKGPKNVGSVINRAPQKCGRREKETEKVRKRYKRADSLGGGTPPIDPKPKVSPAILVKKDPLVTRIPFLP